jgi:hypothetical protein
MKRSLRMSRLAVWGLLLGLLGTAGSLESAEVFRHSTVPPWLEIEILDPNADPRGIPAVVPGAPGSPGNVQIDIPPTVLVHRYYYTGEREFQGPMLPGGPTVVVAGHPRTGERCYVNVQMLPGAPRVIYCGKSIEYNYGDRAVCIHFGLFGTKVTYRNGPAVGQRLEEAGEALHKHTIEAVQESGLSTQVCNLAAKTKTAAHNTCDGVRCVTKAVIVTPATQILQALPFGKMLSTDNGEKHAAEVRNRAVTAAQNAAVRQNATIPTLR